MAISRREAIHWEQLASMPMRNPMGILFQSDLHPADVDEGQIAQVLNNLMINADQAMP
jgi:hypothetical protein